MLPRKLRVEYPGAIYHVLNRGDRRESIFLGDSDRQLFLETLAQTCEKTNWQVHAYGLMDNHFHLVVEMPRANWVEGMRWFLGTYTARFNRRHKLFGHLLSGRYKSLIVDGSGTGYLKGVCEYVHFESGASQTPAPGAAGERGRSKGAYGGALARGDTMTWSWIAKRLEMGPWRTASHAVRRSGSKTRA